MEKNIFKIIKTQNQFDSMTNWFGDKGVLRYEGDLFIFCNIEASNVTMFVENIIMYKSLNLKVKKINCKKIYKIS